MSHGSEYHNPAAFNYAQALLALALKRNRLKMVTEEARTLQFMLAHGDGKMRRFLRGPQIPTPTKTALVERALSGRMDDLLVNMVLMLVRRDRSELLGDVLALFRELSAQQQGMRVGRVTSATDMGLDERVRVKTALEGFLQQRLLLDFSTDPHLIGGIVFQSGDELIDYSVRGRLATLRKRLGNVRV